MPSTALRLMLRHDRRPFCFVVAADYDVRSSFDELVSTAFADATTPAGDDYDLLAIEQACHLLSPLVPVRFRATVRKGSDAFFNRLGFFTLLTTNRNRPLPSLKFFAPY